MFSNDVSSAAPRRLMLLALVFLGLAGRAWGGPARYDAASRSFSLTYTYATLPAYVMTPDQIESLGSLQTATETQDAKFRGVQQAVSQIISQITDGKARIGSLEYVDSIKKADIVVSLTGTPDRGGYSQLGAIEGRPGQIILYYQLLAAEDNQGMINTVAHELCHYVFALPDEYSNGTDCPVSNPDGPGCLMDNYFTRHGFLELCRDATHNAQAPFPGGLIAPHKSTDSCKFWIDKFFEAHPPGPGTSADPGAAGDPSASAAADPPVTAQEPFTGIFKLLVDSATLFVKDKLGAAVDTAKAASTATSVAAKARTLADQFLKEQIPQAATVPGFLKPTDAQKKQALDLIVKKATSGSIKAPASFNPQVVSQLKSKAKELAVTSTGNRPGLSLVQLLLTGQTQDDKLKKLQPVIALVRKGLIAYLTKGLLPGFAPSAAGSSTRLTAEEQKFVDQVAREAVLGSSAPSNMSVFQEAALLHIRLSLNTTETLNALAGELDLPGAKVRNLSLRDLETKIKTALLEKGYALPGRPFTGFGFRRTYIVAPRPLNPDNDFVDIDAGDHIAYEEVRKLAISEMTRLLRRERIEVLDELGPGVVTAAAPVKAVERFQNQVKLINQLLDAVRRNRVENIIIFAPPGGLTQDLGDALEKLRKEIVDNPYSDVRIDLILWDLGTVPLRLRDLVARTGGIVQSVGDVDEFGAIAQRIENDLAAGSWVTTPEQGKIDLSLATKANVRAVNPQAALPPMDLDKIRVQFNGPAQQQAAQAAPALKKSEQDDPPVDTATFSLASRAIDKFNDQLNYFVEYFVRDSGKPDNYAQVGNTIAGLSTIQRNIEEIQGRLGDLKVGDPDHPFQEDLQNLLGVVERTKRLVRTTLAVKDPSLSPLKETDDYYEWEMRSTMVSGARLLHRELEKIPGTSDFVFARNARLGKISFLLQRATEYDQQLTDLRRNIYDLEVKIFNGEIVPSIRFPEDDPFGSYDSQSKQWKVDANMLERRVSSRSYRVGCLMLEAARVLAEKKPGQPVTLVDAKARRQTKVPPSPILRDLSYKQSDAETIARILDAASSQPVNLGELDELLDRLDQRLADIRQKMKNVETPAPSAPASNAAKKLAVAQSKGQQTPKKAEAPPSSPPASDAAKESAVALDRSLEQRLRTRLEETTKLLERLKTRSEDIRNLRAVAGSQEPAPSKPDTRSAPLENGLTPLRESLDLSHELVEDLKALKSFAADNKNLSDEDHDALVNNLAGLMSLDLTAKGNSGIIADMIKLRVDELIYGDFPELLLDVLGRLRMFETELKGLAESVHASDANAPVFQRVKSRRPTAKATASADGKTVDVEFQSFQAEEGAEIELVLGFSRPLKNFEGLKKSPPVLRFLKDDKLVEKPYLGFEADLSTDTMLVWSIPKPVLQVGNIGAGLYKPLITLPIEYLPVLGRDNTLDYTFSVGTPRPNVQLITALRQPQPTVAERDRAKNPEEAYRGTLAADQLEAIIEVQVLSGSSIKAASVTGNFQRFDLTNDPIDSPNLTFLDNGKFPDLQADDGIYTLSIPLVPNTRRKPGEYRLFIQAKSNKDTEFLPVAEPIPVDKTTEDKNDDGVLDADKDKTKQLPKIPDFQRSSSMNFHVSGES